MSQLASSTVVQTLTNYARGLFPDLVASQDPIISRMAPVVTVGAATGKYKNFSDKNAFQNVSTARATGGAARRLEFLASDADFNCNPQALEIGIDDQERFASGGMDAQLEEAKIKTLLTTAAMSHVNDVVTAANAGLSAAVTPTWVNPATCTPIDDIDAQIQAISDDIGMMPTDIIFGLSAWRRFRAAAQVKGSFPNAAAVGVTTEQAAGILLNPAIRIGVSTSIRDANKPGAAKATANMLGSNVYVFFASPNANTMDASFMKVFASGANTIESVRRYREEKSRSDILAVDWSRDIRVTSTVSARRLTVTVA
jgi:hypothetical protein